MIKLFTDIDLDGFGCGLVAKIAFGEKAEVAYCSYRNLNQRVLSFIGNPDHDGDELYITDLAVNEETERRLDGRFQEGKHVRMIDHHITAMHFNEYMWAMVNPEYETGKKTCATSLFYDYLRQHQLINKNHALEEFIELVRQYDTWEWDENNNVTAKRLNDLFYILNREKFEEDMFKRITENPNQFSLTDMENMILDLEGQKINRYIHSKSRQIVQAMVDDFCVGIVHAEQYLSELGNALNTLYPHLDMIALLNMSGKKIGFRTIHDHIDVADYAKSYGGGGHPKASGSELTAEAFEKMVIQVFETPPLKPDADRNELNLKEATYGTVYLNHDGDVSFIHPGEDNAICVIHKGRKLDQKFNSYNDAEHFIKRNYRSWLLYDKDLIRKMTESLSIAENDIKENFPNIVRDMVEKNG